MLDYYGKNNIIPVHQRMPWEDFSNFKFQREQLYSSLGLQPGMVEGKKVIEFGPGTGDNARCMVTWNPREVVLVEGNPSSAVCVKELIAIGHLDSSLCTLKECDLYDIPPPKKSGDQFDIVICEGVINGQKSPEEVLRHVASFVKPGGMLVITTVTPWGVLDQALRRLYLPAIKRRGPSFAEQVLNASSVFSSHLSFLPTTKPIEDWVQDAILHPLSANYLFSSVEVIDSIGTEFIVTGSSPRIFVDFRWHKSLNSRNDDTNQLFCFQSELLSPLSLDARMQDPYRLVNSLSGINRGNLDLILRRIWTMASEVVQNDSYELLSEIVSSLDEIRKSLGKRVPFVSESISDFITAIPHIVSGEIDYPTPIFAQWWGRGLNYLGLRRV